MSSFGDSGWDEKGVLAQAQDVGEPYTKYYLSAYALPLMNAHASLTSAMQGPEIW
jgi:hypothetical protein